MITIHIVWQICASPLPLLARVCLNQAPKQGLFRMEGTHEAESCYSAVTVLRYVPGPHDLGDVSFLHLQGIEQDNGVGEV